MEASGNGSSTDAYSRGSSSNSSSGINTIASTSTSTSGSNSTAGATSSSNYPHPRRYGMPSASTIIRASLSALLEYSGLLRPSPSRPSHHQDTDSLISRAHHRLDDSIANNGEVSIRIIAPGEDDHHETAALAVGPQSPSQHPSPSDVPVPEDLRSNRLAGGPGDAAGVQQGSNGNADGEGGDGAGSSARDSSYQRYDIQQAARWLEQVLPFSLLLLVVFIRQHLQGFFVTIWIAVVMFKSNDILRKQTALKGERKVSVLIGISVAFMLHVVGVYWWYWKDDLLYPLIMLPPKSIPPFWHAIFIIMVNDTLVRQAAMVLKCGLLMNYKNSRGRNYRKQGQVLTLVEYFMLLYRALLPTPVWYCFFLNKEYGSLFSSLMTGLYLTFKLTSVVEKVQYFFTALKALSHKEVHYGAYATSEQVNAAGDLCAICQEKMHAPILLRCKHIFCEDCVSEWFERERTCPLCRALVKPADLRSFGDGSTSLFFQVF